MLNLYSFLLPNLYGRFLVLSEHILGLEEFCSLGAHFVGYKVNNDVKMMYVCLVRSVVGRPT